MASHTEEHIYHPKDAVSRTLKTTMYTGGVGLFASAVQNTLLKQNVGPWGVFVRSGNTIGIMGMLTPTKFVWVDSHADSVDSGHWRYLRICEDGIGQPAGEGGSLERCAGRLLLRRDSWTPRLVL